MGGVHLSSVCFIEDSGISMERTVCSVFCEPICVVSCAIIWASEGNPEKI